MRGSMSLPHRLHEWTNGRWQVAWPRRLVVRPYCYAAAANDALVPPSPGLSQTLRAKEGG